MRERWNVGMMERDEVLECWNNGLKNREWRPETLSSPTASDLGPGTQDLQGTGGAVGTFETHLTFHYSIIPSFHYNGSWLEQDRWPPSRFAGGRKVRAPQDRALGNAQSR